MESTSPSELTDSTLIARAGFASLPDDPADGFFEPDCWLRRVSGQPQALLAGGRALLLEIAHPVVAIGVAQHSNFRRDPFGRLARTLAVMRAITFEDRASGLAAVRAFERAHVPVRGSFDRDVGRHRTGDPYDAADPDARRWVWATLVDTSALVYRRFVAELSASALDSYYADQCAIARLLGVPGELLPKTWPAFEAWFDSVVTGDALCVDARAREIAHAVLHGPLPEADARAARLVTAALLPDGLRRAFGLAFGDAERERYGALEAAVRGLRGSGGIDAGTDPR